MVAVITVEHTGAAFAVHCSDCGRYLRIPRLAALQRRQWDPSHGWARVRNRRHALDFALAHALAMRPDGYRIDR